MWGVCQQGTQCCNEAYIKFSTESKDFANELLPPHIRFDPLDQHDVMLGIWQQRCVDLGRRPSDFTGANLIGADMRAVNLIVVVILGIELS